MRNRNNLKALLLGVVIGMSLTVGTTVLATSIISSATFNDTRVIFNGQELALDQPLISVVLEGETNMRNYMPVRAVLEAMGYTVEWDGANNTAVITSSKTSVSNTPAPPSTSVNAPLMPIIDNPSDEIVDVERIRVDLTRAWSFEESFYNLQRSWQENVVTIYSHEGMMLVMNPVAITTIAFMPTQDGRFGYIALEDYETYLEPIGFPLPPID